MKRDYYSDSISNFLTTDPHAILGELLSNSEFAVESTQRDAWQMQIDVLTRLLYGLGGTIFLEYSISRMGKRVDVLLLIGNAIFVVEFKVGDTRYWSGAMNRVTDYALDLQNFHDTSHDRFAAPILIATEAPVTHAVSSEAARAPDSDPHGLAYQVARTACLTAIVFNQPCVSEPQVSRCHATDT